MKLVYYFDFYLNKNDFKKIMEIVKDAGEIADTLTKPDNDQDYIYIEYQEKIFKFNRYDDYFIQKIEKLQELNPYKGYPDGEWGFFHIYEIDDRFSDKKYYHIKNIKKNQEYVVVFKDLIIEDLYNESFKR